MRASVLAAFKPFSTTFEGYLPWMYVDQKGLVTTGMGNLIDPVENAINLPWTHGVGGPAATQQEIIAAWNAVKNSGANGTGGGNQGGLSDLRLDDDGIQQVIAQKLTNNESILRQNFPMWDSLPADAQLGLLSMAWALGPAFHFPKFQAALNQTMPDWDTAALQSWMKDSSRGSPASLDDDPSNYPPDLNAGLRPRNLANRQLFLNAKQAVATGALDTLIWDISQGLAQLGQAASAVAASAGQYASSAASGAVSTAKSRWPWIVGGLTVATGAAVVAKRKGYLK